MLKKHKYKIDAMKKIVLMFLMACLSLAGKSQKEMVNDPNASVRSVSGDFEKIKISGGIDLFLSQSNEIAIAVSASEKNFKDAIRTEVINGTLHIFYDGEKTWSTLKNKKLRVYVSFKELQNIEASGACDVQVAGVIVVPSLSLKLSGSGDFRGALKVNELNIELSGASDVTIKGSASIISIESTGASDVKGYDFVADYCTAKASGASDVNITVNKEITATASGASDISYKGDAVIKEMHTSGASSVSKKN